MMLLSGVIIPGWNSVRSDYFSAIFVDVSCEMPAA